MKVKLNDEHQTIIDLKKIGALRKNTFPLLSEVSEEYPVHSYFHPELSYFEFVAMIGFEKFIFRYRTDNEVGEINRQRMQQAYHKFNRDYQLIENYLLREVSDNES